MVNTVSFQAPTDYSAEQEQIARQRALAQAMQQQALSPLESQTAPGGLAVPTSPMLGISKLVQAMMAGKGMTAADEQTKALSAKIGSERSQSLLKAMQMAQGTPARSVGANEMGDDAYNVPAQQGDYSAAGASLIGNNDPALQAMGMQMMQKGMSQQSMQKFIEALKGSGGIAAPQPGQPAGPTNAAAQSQGGGMGGLSPAFLAAAMSGDPSVMELGKAAQTAFAKEGEAVNVRPGGTVYKNGRAVFTAPNQGQQINWQNGQPSSSLVPGAIANEANRAGQIAGAEAWAKAGANPVQVQMPDQSNEYVPQAWLARNPPAFASQPGAQQPQQPPNPMAPQMQQPVPQQPQPMAPQQAPQLQPVAAPGQVMRPGQMPRAQVLAEELQNQTAIANNPQTPPQQRQQAQQNVAAVQQEIARLPKSEQAQLGRFGQSQENKITQERQTAGGKTVDEAFGKDYVSWTTGMGADAAKQLGQLGDVTKALQQPGANLTGPWLGHTPDFVKSFTNPQSIAMRERVEEVVQRSLRAILGAQFTEKEGERLIARAYNPNQPEAENAVRVNRLYTQLQQAFQAKQDAAKYYQANGTLQGWNGKLYSISDFEPDPTGSRMSVGQIGASGGAPNPQDIVNELRKRGVVQ